MTHAIPFDTLAYAKTLESRGVEITQAEAHAQTLAEILENNVSTKEEARQAINNISSEISHLRKDMDIRFSELRKDMDVKFSKVDAKFSELKSELIKWVFGISFAQAALIISILKFFH